MITWLSWFQLEIESIFAFNSVGKCLTNEIKIVYNGEQDVPFATSYSKK